MYQISIKNKLKPIKKKTAQYSHRRVLLFEKEKKKEKEEYHYILIQNDFPVMFKVKEKKSV